MKFIKESRCTCLFACLFISGTLFAEDSRQAQTPATPESAQAAQAIAVEVPKGTKPTVLATAKVGKPAAVPTEDIQLNQVPPPTTRDLLMVPKNLARWHMGAALFIANNGPLQPFNWRDADDGQSPGLLMGDDPSAELDLTPDVYKFVIELNDYYLVRRFTFKNFNAQGSVQVYTSDSLANANSQAWTPLADPVAFSEEGYVSVRFDEVDTKHLLLVFDITTEGSIGIFGVYGDMSVAETRLPRTRQDAENMTIASPNEDDTTKFNFGSVATGSKVSHVSSGDASTVQKMNDDDVETYYEFPEDSKEDVLIVDMAEQKEINRISMLFESPPGVFDLYLTNDLPEGMEELQDDKAVADGSGPAEDDTALMWSRGHDGPESLLAAAPGSLGEWLFLAAFAQDAPMTLVTLPTSFFENNEHAMQFEVDGTEGRFRADFEIIEMRYLIVRFTPAEGAPPGSGLRIFEVGLFGDVPEEYRRLVRVPVFDFFENAVDLTPDLAPPTGDGDEGAPPGGGDLPRPPPPVSP